MQELAGQGLAGQGLAVQPGQPMPFRKASRFTTRSRSITNAACIMIGERGPEMIGRDYGVKLSQFVG
jgi:hypothetical protein